MKLFNVNGKKTAIVNIFIDPENGFSRFDIPDSRGGSLYVPGGEQVAPLMGDIIEKSRGSIFILGQDYHPRTHISFMVNHPGVMEYRIAKFKEFLAENGQPVPESVEELNQRAQQPVHFFGDQVALFPFPEIVLDENRDIIGLKESDGRIRKVELKTTSGQKPTENDRGRVRKVLDTYYPQTFDEYRAEGLSLSTQTLWTMHCVQGTESCLYPAALKLPKGLEEKLQGDLMKSYIDHRDEATDNHFWVIRKGWKSEIDSYGIGVENDRKTKTIATEVFAQIGDMLRNSGCQQVIINIGGLATNFCVEFSANNTEEFLAGEFKISGMETKINFVPEISRGIPIPGNADTPFSLDGASMRMAARGIREATIREILAYSTSPSLSRNFPRLQM